jgi:CheY-like chemotaxis protein
MVSAQAMSIEQPQSDLPLVLVVEDAQDSYELLTDALAEAGFRVVGAHNGIDAVDCAVKLVPDAIVMDLSLPLLGGCEAARLLKSDPRTRDIPIIALTGHRHFSEKAREAGCDGFLAKPCTPERIFDEIRRLLPRTRGTVTIN